MGNVFFAFSGDHLDGTPPEIYEAAEVITRLHPRFFKDDTEKKRRKEHDRQFRRAMYESFRERDKAAKVDRLFRVNLLEMMGALGAEPVLNEHPLVEQNDSDSDTRVIDVPCRIVHEGGS